MDSFTGVQSVQLTIRNLLTMLLLLSMRNEGNFRGLGQSLNRIVTIVYYKEERGVIHVST